MVISQAYFRVFASYSAKRGTLAGAFLFRIPGFRGKFQNLRNFDEQNPPLGHIDGLLGAEIFRIGMVFRTSHHISLSDPMYYPYL